MTDRELEKIAEILADKLSLEITAITKKILKEVALQLELFADDLG